MAASLTLSTVAVAADGRTITATIGGGTAPYSISSTAGLVPHLTTGNKEGFYVSSASVSGTTLTMVCGSTIGSGEVIQLDIATSSTLTDSAANTPTGQTNVAAANSSGVAVTVVSPVTNPQKFEMDGGYAITGSQLNLGQGNWLSGVDNYSVELVANATEVAMVGYSGDTTKYRIDGASADSTAPSNGFWSIKPLASGLAAGNHLVLIGSASYFAGVRLVGGTSTVNSVATTKRTMVANISAYAGVPQATPLTVSGPYKLVNSAQAGKDGAVTSGSYAGFTVEFSITSGTGAEVATVFANAGQWAVSVDGGQYGPMRAAGDTAANGVYGFVPLAVGLASGSTHTIHAVSADPTASLTHHGIRIINGTALTAASSAGASTLTVGSTSTIAVGDWVRIDKYGNREWRQVTGISGTTLTLNATLALAHAIGAQVTSYMAPAGTIGTYQLKPFAKRLLAMGDSNTAGANEYGIHSTNPDANGNYYGWYDPRQSAIFLGADPLNYEVINLGVQGQTSANMVTRQADMAAFSRTGVDYVVIWPGTNDINGTTITPATYQSQVESLVTAAATTLNAGGTIVLMAPYTPSTTNSGGLNTASATTALQAVAANHSANTVVAVNAFTGLVAGDVMDGLHYTASGRQKVGTNLQPYIGASATPAVGAAVLTGMFAGV